MKKIDLEELYDEFDNKVLKKKLRTEKLIAEEKYGDITYYLNDGSEEHSDNMDNYVSESSDYISIDANLANRVSKLEIVKKFGWKLKSIFENWLQSSG